MQVPKSNSSEQKQSRGTDTARDSFTRILVLPLSQLQPIDKHHRGNEDTNGAAKVSRITKSIPSWLGALPRLLALASGGNRISGEFPRELCTLPMLLSEETAPQVDGDVLELPIYISTNATFCSTSCLTFLT
ncbi:hypothetical protein COP2_005773 [Malus domestica]